MSYLVTHGNRPGPVGIDVANNKKLDLEGALAQACHLLSEGYLDVAVQDGNGKRISGPDLFAYCQGEKKLTTADFRSN